MQKQIYKQARLDSFQTQALQKQVQLVTIGIGVIPYTPNSAELAVPGVGKSAVTVRFCTDKFLEEYDPTIEDSFRFVNTGKEILDQSDRLRAQHSHLYSKQLNLNGDQVKINILDTAGQEEYRCSALPGTSALRQQWYRSGDGFLFIFSVAARETFDELTRLHEEISRAREHDNPGIPCVIVANKCDLKGRRQVSSMEARALAKRFGCPFVETSAKTGLNIDLAFRQCARRVVYTDMSDSLRQPSVRL
ncbi:hypothetical protein NliqN6_4932, partial [Naganishia liquefaciens]